MKSTAYPFWNCPSEGVTNKLPDYYQDYLNEMKKKQQEKEDEINRERDRQWGNFDPFGEYGPRSNPFNFDFDEEEQHDQNYPYCVFGLKHSASQDDMKQAYREAVRATHPDKTGENTEDEFREVQEAYEYYREHHL
tara:strand:+ start:34 stop:441 length:408 start_codon:yes stop_codon:yes gene_type:complete